MASPSTRTSDSANLPENFKPRLAASYNAIAETYNAWTANHFDTRHAALRTLISKLEARSRSSSDGKLSSLAILELGCGSGLPVIKTILEHFEQVKYTANELSSKQIELAHQNLGKELAARVTFVVGDMLALDFPATSLDAVIAMYSIIHLPRAEQTQLMHKCRHWLKSSGLLLANFAVEEAEQVVIPHWLQDEGWMFWSSWGADGTLEELRQAGFEILESSVKMDVADASFLWILAQKP